MTYLLYNDLADGGNGKINAEAAKTELEKTYPGLTILSLLDMNVREFLSTLKEEDNAILMGGDGTLNHFINDFPEDFVFPCHLFLYPSGTGNDFLNDVEEKQDKTTGLVPLNEFVSNLPYVEVKGKTYRFINGIGYGIDGDCCVKAEEMKKEGKKDINYSNITIGLLFGEYKPKTATIIVDGGEPVTLKKTYMAAAMNGRYYGGGMKIAPDQKRGSNLLSIVSIHGRGKLGTFMMFPGIFKGKHIKNKKNTFAAQGKVIEVSYDAPCGLQIDGEVINDVTSYKVWIK